MENQKNKVLFPNPMVKLSIVPLLLLVKFNGCFIYRWIFMLQLPKSLPYNIILKVNSTLLLIIVFHEHMKHLEIDCHLVRDKFQPRVLMLLQVSTQEQLVDFFMKSLLLKPFSSLLSKMNLVNIYQYPSCEGEIEDIVDTTASHPSSVIVNHTNSSRF